jgi:hypothetical protein
VDRADIAKYQPSSSVLEPLYSVPEHGKADAAILERLRLNVFAEPHLDARDLAAGTETAQFGIDTINGKPAAPGQTIEVGADDALQITGWATDASGSVAAPAIFATIDGATDIPGRMGLLRQPVDRVPKPLRWTGFGVSFGGFRSESGELEVALKIVSGDQRHFLLTAPVVRIFGDDRRVSGAADLASSDIIA